VPTNPPYLQLKQLLAGGL